VRKYIDPPVRPSKTIFLKRKREKEGNLPTGISPYGGIVKMAAFYTYFLDFFLSLYPIIIKDK